MTMRVMVNGLPGNMATLVVERLLSGGHEVIPFALTGPEIDSPDIEIQGHQIRLIKDDKDDAIKSVKFDHWPFQIVDFTHPNAAVSNAELYCKYGLPFVMGTTGGDPKAIKRVVEESGNTAVLAPNMAPPIVVIQAMFEYAGLHFPGALEGYKLKVNESHQQGKADTSGTAKAMVEYFNRLGCVPFTVEQIGKMRDPAIQIQMGVPKKHLDGHAHHNYTLRSPDGTVALGLMHNINGRDAYVDGAMLALEFLNKKLATGERGLYSMIDVLSAE